MGTRNAYILAAFAAIAQVSVVFVFIKWGRKFRSYTADRYAKYATGGH